MELSPLGIPQTNTVLSVDQKNLLKIIKYTNPQLSPPCSGCLFALPYLYAPQEMKANGRRGEGGLSALHRAGKAWGWEHGDAVAVAVAVARKTLVLEILQRQKSAY